MKYSGLDRSSSQTRKGARAKRQIEDRDFLIGRGLHLTPSHLLSTRSITISSAIFSSDLIHTVLLPEFPGVVGYSLTVRCPLR